MKKTQDASNIYMQNVFNNQEDEHTDEDSIDCGYSSKGYPIIEHLSNARIMPLTGPYGGLDLPDTYEYGTVPENPSKPLDSYELVMEKNTQK